MIGYFKNLLGVKYLEYREPIHRKAIDDLQINVMTAIKHSMKVLEMVQELEKRVSNLEKSQ